MKSPSYVLTHSEMCIDLYFMHVVYMCHLLVSNLQVLALLSRIGWEADPFDFLLVFRDNVHRH